MDYDIYTALVNVFRHCLDEETRNLAVDCICLINSSLSEVESIQSLATIVFGQIFALNV